MSAYVMSSAQVCHAEDCIEKAERFFATELTVIFDAILTCSSEKKTVETIKLTRKRTKHRIINYLLVNESSIYVHLITPKMPE